jgi:diguanylate cyclase (GGDEF)-like protein/PAS domain S-box-containing protein
LNTPETTSANAATDIDHTELYQELERSQALFQATFEHAGAGLSHVAPDGRWLRVNQKLCDIVGYTRDELLGKTFQEITHPDDLDVDLGLSHQVLAGEIPSYSLEKRYVHRDGHAVWTNLTVTLVRTNTGEPDFFVSIVEDIHRRKAAEEALANEREKFRALVEISAEYFWEMDDQFRLTDYSRSVSDQTGRGIEQLLGKRRWEIPYVGVSDAAWAQHRSTLDAHLPFRHFEGGLTGANGETRWYQISGNPVFSPAGVFLGYRGVTQDVTERQHVEQRLKQHALLFETSQQGVVITDPDGLVIDANAAFERITEYSLAEVLGKNLRLLQSGRHDAAFYKTLWKSVETTGSWEGEIWNRRRGGEVYLEWIAIRSVTDSRGAVTAYIGTHIDINRMQHVRSETERLAHHDALTGLPNRLQLLSRLRHAVDRVKRGGCGAVLFLDLDRFKAVNDASGHRAGDDLLVAVGARLSGRLRAIDTLARLGGDEFVVVLEDVTSRSQVEAVAAELIRQLALPFDLPEWGQMFIGGSIGIALFPQDGTDSMTLLERADQGLYAAKRAGKGVARFYSDEHGD